MKKVAVLGAGYMGSAITFPLAENGFEVNLWGTWLDDNIINSCLKGKHPKLKKPLHKNVNLYHSKDLKKAIIDRNIIFIGITSEGFLPVFKKLLESIEDSKEDYIFFTLTKGFVNHRGKVKQLSSTAKELFEEKFPRKKFKWASIGGPVKAVELSDHIPSLSIYGINSSEIKKLAKLFSTDYYRVLTSADVSGVEICSALKNIYSIAPGICDGMYKSTREGMYHNFNSILFNQGIIEMSKIVYRIVGNKNTVFNLAGIGDLYVTAQSGRNRRLGELIGKKIKPKEAYQMMYDDGEIGEGYNTLNLAIKWLDQLDKNLLKELPLLNSLNKIIFKNYSPCLELKSLVKDYF